MLLSTPEVGDCVILYLQSPGYDVSCCCTHNVHLLGLYLLVNLNDLQQRWSWNTVGHLC